MIESSYYPPRARDRWVPQGIALVLDRGAMRVARWFSRIRPAIPGMSIPFGQWVMAMLLPGYGYAVEGRRKLAWIMAASWVASLIVFVLFLGHTWVSGWALGGLASSHASGIGYLLLRERERDSGSGSLGLRAQVGIPFAVWFLWFVVVYLPLSSIFQRQIAQPLPLGDRIVIVNSMTQRASIKPGDRVAIRIAAQNFGGVAVRGGVTWGTYYGGPDSTVQFARDHVLVNGAVWARFPQMPESGELKLDRETLFIWPTLDERILNIPWGSIESAYVELSQVSERNFVGRPFRRWFFWRQDSL